MFTGNTAKNAQVLTSLLTSCNNLLQQADIRMGLHGLRRLVTTNLLQVVNRLVASWLFQQACCKLFQQVVRSIQMTSCNKPDLDRLVATWWNWQTCCNLMKLTGLLTSCNRPIKLTTCNTVCGVFGCEHQLNYSCANMCIKNSQGFKKVGRKYPITLRSGDSGENTMIITKLCWLWLHF